MGTTSQGSLLNDSRLGGLSWQSLRAKADLLHPAAPFGSTLIVRRQPAMAGAPSSKLAASGDSAMSTVN